MLYAIFACAALNSAAPTSPSLEWMPPTGADASALAVPVVFEPAVPAPILGGDANFSYTFVELGAIKLDPDDNTVSNEDVDSFYLRGSLGISFFHIFAQYEDQQLDFMDTRTDLYRLGAGVHFSVLPKLDIVGEAAWLYSDLTSDISQLDDTTDGVEGKAGVRWMPFAWDGGGVELAGNLVYIDLENRLASEDIGQGWEAGARLHFLRWFSIGAMYGLIDDDDQISANARFSF